MGMFDSVMVPCPKCGKLSEFQSKGGDCLLWVYTLDTAPADVLSDVNRHAPNTCDECGTKFAAQVDVSAKSVEVHDTQSASQDRAHEIWAAAQLAPGEGIEDGVSRIQALLNQR